MFQSLTRHKISPFKLENKLDIPINDSTMSNHFSQQSFLEISRHEALLKSFELEYEIEDNTGDKILLMNFSKKKKLSIDTSSNKTKIVEEPKKSTNTLTAISMSPKLELLSGEFENDSKNDKNFKKIKSLAFLKPAPETKKSTKIENVNLNMNLARTCPNLKSLNEIFQEKMQSLKKDKDIEDYRSYQPSESGKIEDFDGFHIRNSSWDNFSNLIPREKDYKQYGNFMNNDNSEKMLENFNYEQEKKAYKNDCFSFAEHPKQIQEDQIKKTVFLHIPGYLKDEIKEQNFTHAQQLEKEQKNKGLTQRNLILQELYSVQQIKKKSENKENMMFTPKSQKDKNIKVEKKLNTKNNGSSNRKNHNLSLSKNNKPNVRFFEAARIANVLIENLEKQVKNKCL